MATISPAESESTRIFPSFKKIYEGGQEEYVGNKKPEAIKMEISRALFEIDNMEKNLERFKQTKYDDFDVCDTIVTIYRYALVQAFFFCPFLFVLGAIPWSKWDVVSNANLPSLNKEVYFLGSASTMGLLYASMITFTYASFWESGVQLRPEFAYRHVLKGLLVFLACFFTITLSIIYGFGLNNTDTTINFTAPAMWSIVILSAVIIAFVVCSLGIHKSYNNLEMRRRTKLKQGFRDKRRSSWGRLLQSMNPEKTAKNNYRHLWMVLNVTIFTFMTHITLIILTPILLSSETSDTTRVIILVVVLTIVSEIIQICLRFFTKFSGLTAISNQALSLYIDTLLQFYRRVLLGAMRDPTFVYWGLFWLSMEEGILRCTLAERDLLIRKLVGMQPVSSVMKRKVRIVNVSMLNDHFQPYTNDLDTRFLALPLVIFMVIVSMSIFYRVIKWFQCPSSLLDEVSRDLKAMAIDSYRDSIHITTRMAQVEGLRQFNKLSRIVVLSQKDSIRFKSLIFLLADLKKYKDVLIGVKKIHNLAELQPRYSRKGKSSLEMLLGYRRKADHEL
eukprot:g4061.t1